MTPAKNLQNSNSITVKELVVVYADGTRAVNDISFNVKEGEFFGFLGPNGAGKSTTIKVLTTLLRKTSGSVTIAGYDLDKDAKEIRKVIGVQSQETVVDPELTGKENLTFQGHYEQMRRNLLEKRVEELLSLVELKDVEDKPAGHYSGGMKKRLDLATALVHRPKVLFLDEPTAGLDPQSRSTMWEYLKRINEDEGITIFLTTQNMDEADKLCRQLSIIDHGELIAKGSPEELKQGLHGEIVTLSIRGSADSSAARTAKETLASIEGVNRVQDSEGGLTIYVKKASSTLAQIVNTLEAKHVSIASISYASPSLDDVFLQHTGRRIRTEELRNSSDRSSPS